MLTSSLDFFDAITAQHSEYPIGLTFELISEAARNENLRTILREDYDKRLEILAGFLQEQRSNRLLRANVDVSSLAVNLSALFNGLIIALVPGKEVENVRQTWSEAIRGLMTTVVT